MTSVKPNGLVEFRFYRLDAQDVKVVGSFNGWGTRPLTLTRDAEYQGWWSAQALLDPGEYTFRYKVNGTEWFTDYAANGVERTKHGWNSILVVPESKARKTPLAADKVTEAVAA
jgi:1,4-alpha-glucan branching enzyme